MKRRNFLAGALLAPAGMLGTKLVSAADGGPPSTLEQHLQARTTLTKAEAERVALVINQLEKGV